MTRLPHEHRLDLPLQHAPVRLIPGEDLESGPGDSARVAKNVVVARVQDHVGDAVAVYILEGPDAWAGGEAVDLYLQLLTVEVKQLKHAAVCAGAAVQGQPGVAGLDLHLSQAALAHIIRGCYRRVAGREFLTRQLLPVAIGLRIDRDEVVRQGREVEVAHPDAVNGPQRRLTGCNRQRQGDNPLKCTLGEPSLHKLHQAIGGGRRGSRRGHCSCRRDRRRYRRCGVRRHDGKWGRRRGRAPRCSRYGGYGRLRRHGRACSQGQREGQ